MNNSNRYAIHYVIFITLLISTISVFTNAVDQHKNWKIALAIVSFALIVAAVVVTYIGYKKEKREQVS
jgi:Fe2+ transport system protein B